MTNYLAPLLIAGLLGSTLYFVYDAGQASVQHKWDESEKAKSKVVSQLKEDIARKEGEHRQAIKEIEGELQASAAEYQASLTRLGDDYANRLLLSDTRAGVYQRQARGNATERDRLASHAAELDRSLEEGRSLVAQLRDTIKQRDGAIRALGSMILTERKLFESSETNGR